MTIVIFWVAQGTAINLGVCIFLLLEGQGRHHPDDIGLRHGRAVHGRPGVRVLTAPFEKKDICTQGIIVVCVFCRRSHTRTSTNGLALTVLCIFSFTQSVMLPNLYPFNLMMVDATDEHDLLFE